MKTAALLAHWRQLAPRERLAVTTAAAVVALALLWWVVLGPAIGVLRGAQAQHALLDAQLQGMGALQAQAQTLKSQPRQSYEEAMRQLDSAVRQSLGANSRLAVSGDRATVTVAAVPPDVLAQWLAQARVAARVVPAEARLSRNAGGLWDGTVVLALPPR
jgi:general secretion pathway protein M